MQRLKSSHFGIFDLIIIDTPYDGSCFFHAILRCLNTKYISSSPQNKSLIAKELRYDLSEKLSSELDNLEDFGYSDVKSLLRSNSPMGYEILEPICKMLNINIYIVFSQTKDLYPFGRGVSLYDKNRSSIIIYYDNNHYQSIGIIEKNELKTHFSEDHGLILNINKKLNLQ